MSENQNMEWKETWKDEYLKWICGFANANGFIRTHFEKGILNKTGSNKNSMYLLKNNVR